MGVGKRNNNPGCIRSGRGYAKYATLEDGYMALNSLLYRMYDRKTLKEMFDMYAPSGDGSNDPSQYAKNVLARLRKMGYDIDFNTRLDFSDPEFRAAMTMAISIQETGSVLGGEEVALSASRNYNPANDRGKRYAATEARRAKYGSVKMVRNGSAPASYANISMNSSLPGIAQVVNNTLNGQTTSLSDILRSAGSTVQQNGGVQKNQQGRIV